MSQNDSFNLAEHNVRRVMTLVRDNELLDTGDYTNAAIPGDMYIGTEKIASYQHSHYDDGEITFFDQVSFNGGEAEKIEASIKTVVKKFEQSIVAPVDTELCKIVLEKLTEVGGVSGNLYYELVKSKILSVEDLLATGILSEDEQRILLNSL